MSYTVTVNQENRGEGAKVLIHGLGTFENGKAHEVTDEEAEAFRSRNSYVDEEGKLQPGKPLDELNFYGVTVTKSGNGGNAEARKKAEAEKKAAAEKKGDQ